MIVFVKRRVKDEYKTIPLEVEPSDTIKNVKAKIEDKEGIPTDEQVLFCADQGLGVRLLSDDFTIDYYHYEQCVRPKATIYLAPSDKNYIVVDTPKREIVTPTVHLSDTIKDVKAKIEALEGTPAKYQRLSIGKGHKELEDRRTLSSYGVKYHTDRSEDVFMLLDYAFLSIYVMNHKGETILLRVDASSKAGIEYIKSIIHKMEGIPPDQQLLFFRDRELQYGRTLSSYGIQKEDVLHVVHLSNDSRHRGNAILIFVNFFSDKIFPLEIDPSEAITALKAKIQDKEGIPTDQQRLLLMAESWKMFLGKHSLTITFRTGPCFFWRFNMIYHVDQICKSM